MKFGKTNSNPSTETGVAQSVTIGDITISQFGDGALWIESEADGDAGSFSEDMVASALKNFYDMNL